MQIILFPPKAAVDQVFAYTGTSAREYTTNLYENGGAGRFEANYFNTNLESRGLINSTIGPALKNFPFYEDASTIYDAIHTFMTSFVESYYNSDSVLKADKELQAWVKEANGPAKAIDFPASISSTETLADILTHFVCPTVARSLVTTEGAANSALNSGPPRLNSSPHSQHQ